MGKTVGVFKPGDRERQGTMLDSMPTECDCPERYGSFNRHGLIRVRNDKGVIRFCPVTRVGWIQYDSSGIILDGVFSGNMDGD